VKEHEAEILRVEVERQLALQEARRKLEEETMAAERRKSLARRAVLDAKIDLMAHNEGAKNTDIEVVREVVDVLSQYRIGVSVLNDAQMNDRYVGGDLKGMLWKELEKNPADKERLEENLLKLNGGVNDLLSKVQLERFFKRKNEQKINLNVKRDDDGPQRSRGIGRGF